MTWNEARWTGEETESVKGSGMEAVLAIANERRSGLLECRRVLPLGCGCVNGRGDVIEKEERRTFGSGQVLDGSQVSSHDMKDQYLLECERSAVPGWWRDFKV